MKKLLKCVSVFVLVFALMPIVKADGPAEAITSGNLTLKSIPLTKEKDRMWYPNVQEEFSEWDDYDLDIDDEDINKGVLKKWNEEHDEIIATKNVTITYEYDEAIKKVVDGLIAKLGDNPIEFELNDVEALTYRISADSYLTDHPEYQGEIDFPFFFSNFSLDLMKTIEYKNFNLLVGAGGGYYLNNSNMGELSFIYDDVFYGCGPTTIIQYNAVVFIPEGATDVPKAIKDRLSKYFNVKSVSDTYGNIGPLTAKDLAEIKDRQYYQTNKNDSSSVAGQYATEDEYIASIDYNTFIYGDYATKDSPVYFVEMADGAVAAVVVYEDSEKNADEREFKTSDVGTGIEVSVDGIIPLDTLIHVARVTSGDEYDKIVKILKNNNVYMFDLKMITKSNETITKLDDGKFRVKLPIKEEFKGKELKVYYVGDDDKVEEYKVTISDDGNYAIFETDHFSIYTLAAGAATKNPKTGDSIMIYVAILILSSAYLLTRKLRKN